MSCGLIIIIIFISGLPKGLPLSGGLSCRLSLLLATSECTLTPPSLGTPRWKGTLPDSTRKLVFCGGCAAVSAYKAASNTSSLCDHARFLGIMQNRAARAVYGCSPRTSARNLLVQLGAYHVREIFIQQFIFLVWRCHYSRASSTPQVLLLPTKGAPTPLQSTMGLRPPPTRTDLEMVCLSFQGARLWNAVPSEVPRCPARYGPYRTQHRLSIALLLFHTA